MLSIIFYLFKNILYKKMFFYLDECYIKNKEHFGSKNVTL